ncbi:biotin--[acetyl-CoA-carboxylase] ligase [Verrucomicrobiota bacterium]
MQDTRYEIRNTRNGLWGGRLMIFESLPSTNQWALENIADCRHGDVIRAIHQTAGKGRFLREWITPENTCLTITIVLKPQSADESLATAVMQMAACAVRATLEKFKITALLKWPNDVVVNGRKTAGILAENDPANHCIVLGIGMNVNLTEHDLGNIQLLQPATSMAIEKEQAFDIEQVCSELLNEFETLYNKSSCLKIWGEHDFLTGKSIEVQTTDNIITGQYNGIDDQGRLCLTDSSGKKHEFWSGDITLRNSD